MQSNCWNCGSATAGHFCPNCKALQPPAADYFEFFGIPRHLAIDLKDLEKRFYALSRQLHPDLFSRKSEKEKEYSLESTAILNDAYRVLRDPVARAQYVLKQEGFEVGEQGTKDVPPELLEEVFELNMALEEMREADAESSGSAKAQLLEFRTRFEGMREGVDQDLARTFTAWDAGHNRDALNQLRGLLNRRKYITNLIAQTQTA